MVPFLDPCSKYLCSCFFLFYLLESVYDLLPKELQLPPSRELSVASMSQTSGGEAGSPPPGVVAAGKYFQWARLSLDAYQCCDQHEQCWKSLQKRD